MTQSGFWTRETGRLATAYRTSVGPDGELDVEAWDLPDGKYSQPPAFEDGAGGLVSTADDLLAFARVPARRRLGAVFRLGASDDDGPADA